MAESDVSGRHPTLQRLLKSRKRRMKYANICIVPGCAIKQSDKAYSFHTFPANPKLRKKWIKFVSTAGLVSFRFPTNYTCICSGHFEPDCFPYSIWLKKSMGLQTRRVLNPGSVPTILKARTLEGSSYGAQTACSTNLDHPPEDQTSHCQAVEPGTRAVCLMATDDGPSLLNPKGVRRVRGAYRKREHRRIIDALLADSQKDISKKEDSSTGTVLGNTYTNIATAEGVSLVYVQPKWHGKYEQPRKTICNKIISTLSSHDVLIKKALETVSRYEEFCPLVLEVENTEKAAQHFELRLECTEEAMDHVQNPEPEMAVKPEPEMEVKQEPEIAVKQESERAVKGEQPLEFEEAEHPFEWSRGHNLTHTEDEWHVKLEVKQEPCMNIDYV